MMKNLVRCRFINSFQIFLSHSYSLVRQQSEHTNVGSRLKPYQILLRSSIENSIKFPSQDVLKLLRSRGITKIMAANHVIDDTDQVLQAHVECLYSLIHRAEPSIEAISMFTEAIYNHIEGLSAQNITSPALLNLLQPTILTKIVLISQMVEPFYNETYRSLISALIIRLLQQSVTNEAQYHREMRKIGEAVKQVQEGREVKDSEGNIITKESAKGWQSKRSKQIAQSLLFANELDYCNGFQFVLSMEYFTDQFLLDNMARLERVLERDLRGLKLPEVMVKIKSIVELHRFKNHKEVGATGIRALFLAYNKLVEQYFRILTHEPNLFEIVSSDQPVIQAQLLTTFLTQEHYERAKKVYLQVFKAALNVSNNGVLLIDVSKLKGIFEVMLVLYGHEDTKQMHLLLAQLEKVMTMYPLQKFEKLETHCFVADKFGYKSEYFAEKLFKLLLQQKEKLERNRGHIHHVHQVTREINLARKFLLYLRVASKPNKQQIQFASKLATSLFDQNVWYLLTESDPLSETFLTGSSFSHHLYFVRAGIQSLTAGQHERRRIDSVCSAMGLKNLSRLHGQVMQDLKSSCNRHSLKLDNHSNWRHNPYARMCNLLHLANHHHDQLSRHSPQEAATFIQQFLSKSLGSTLFYNTLKQRFAFPGIFQNFMELMDKADPKNFPIQSRDLEAMKRLYQAQLLKIMKASERPPFAHYYQEHLDVVEYNKVMIPFNQEVYGLPNLGSCASRSLLYHAMRRFEKQKEYLRMQIETFLKFNKTGGVVVLTNYLELPHLADLHVTLDGQSTVVLFRSYEGEPNHFLNYKQVEMQREAETYWRKKGLGVFVVRGQKDLEDFMKKIMKQPEDMKKAAKQPGSK